jgi:tetratricopeptide (TPR) repeat protein/predicted Ser/Thr protein kinase
MPAVPGFEILKELGRGTFGVVYLARQAGLDWLVALKMVLYRTHESSEVLERFRAEARALARVPHPNIVQIRSVGEHDGLPYFVLEYVGGGTLRDALRAGPKPPHVAADVVESLARALHHAHSEGIIHRDLKPANILLTPEGVPKVADFGLAKSLDLGFAPTRSGYLMGTLLYMSPEQVLAKKDLGAPSDQYALGVILYELLTGHQPFKGASDLDTMEQIAYHDAVPPSRSQPRVPRDLDVICLKCLEKDPMRRYPDCFELAEELRRFQIGARLKYHPVLFDVDRFRRWSRRNRRIAALSATVLGLLVTLSIVLATATFLIARARDRAETERDRAEGLAVEASKNQLLALGTYRDVLVRFDSALGDRPDLAQVRRAMLEDTKAKIEAFRDHIKKLKLHNAGASDEADRYLAASYQRLGDIDVELRGVPAALENYHEALAITDALLKKDPRNPGFVRNSAIIHNLLGDVCLNHRFDATTARKHYALSLELRKEWARLARNGAPGELDKAVHAQANTYGLLALTSLRQGDPARARRELHEERKLRGSLSPSYVQGGEALALKMERAGMEDRLGEVAFKLRDPRGAFQGYDAALAIRKTLPDPTSLGSASGLALSYEYLGDVNLYLAGAPEISRQRFQDALELFERLRAEFPMSLSLKKATAHVLYRLGEAYRQLAQPEKSREFYNRSRMLREEILRVDPEDTDAMIDLAIVRARCGAYDEAVQLARKARGQAPDDAGALFHIACAFAQCVAHQKAFADEAVRALEQAAAHGWQDYVSIQTDPDLIPIQQEPGLRRLVDDIKRKLPAAER